MKILVINGGTRKCNTHKLAACVMDYIKTNGQDSLFEEIDLASLHLPYCKGCSLCFRNGHAVCPHHAIIQPVLDKIAECDGVIFYMPTYNMQPPAITKNLLDHLCFMLHRPRYFDKKALVVSTTGGVGAKKSVDYVAGTLAGFGFNRCYKLAVTSTSWNAFTPDAKQIKQTQKAAKRFLDDLESNCLHAPSFGVLIPYNLFRGISRDYLPGTPYPTYDGVFWEESGLQHTAYSPQTPLPFYKKLFGNLFYLTAKKLSKKMIATYKK